MGDIYNGINIGASLGNLLTNSRFGVWSSSTPALSGVELSPNPGFANVDGLTATDATLASVAGGQSGNCLEITRTGGSLQSATFSIATVVNQLYAATVYAKAGTSGNEVASIHILDAADAEIEYTAITTSGSWQSMTRYFRAKTTTTKIVLRKNSATAGTMLFDTDSVQSFVPAYVGADGAAPDGWIKTVDLDLFREVASANVDAGALYAMKASPAAVNQFVHWCPEPAGYNSDLFYSRFAGRTMTMRCRVKTSVGAHAFLEMNDGTNSFISAVHTGNGEYQDLEVTGKFSATPTAAYCRLFMMKASGDVYWCKPSLIYGTGGGNKAWQPMANEQIIFNTPVLSDLFWGTLASSDNAGTDLCVESDSWGAVPRDARAVLVRANIRDSGSATGESWLKLRENGAGGDDWGAIFSCGGLANDSYHYGSRQWVEMNNGLIEYLVEATGSLTTDINAMAYCGVQYS